MIDVLVVDDDEEFGELIVERLSSDGISAALQCGPFGTINRIRRERPALVILDVNMPAISGQEVSKLIRETEGLEGTKLLLMSSMDQQQLDSVKKQVKADEALTKSTERLQLLATVKRLLQRARAEHKAGGC
jgi:DNA-binding response OmpR family regulator